jgi:hypothetical protein
MIETRLNIDELEEVIEKSKDPIYKQPNLIFLCNKKTDIVRVTPKHNLIFIFGNSKTGMNHINDRHNYLYHKPYWKEDKKSSAEKIVLEVPSRFHLSTTPYFDYTKIAEDLFNNENLKVESNKKPKFFDVYEGIVDLKRIEPIPYRLVLYKGTKVIHTLYPISNKYTPEKIVNYRRGGSTFSMNPIKGTSTLEIPYYNHLDDAIYKLIIRFHEIDKKEKFYIQKNTNDGTPFIVHYIGERTLTVTEVTPKWAMSFDIADLSYFERIILRMEKK